MRRGALELGIAVALVLAGCGGTETETVTETEHVYDTITLTETVTETEYVTDTIIQTETVGEATAMVTITGDFVVMVGATLELIAETVDGEDSGYEWTSNDEDVATVVDGVVTGLMAGEALITATGLDTEASAMHGVVVMAEGGIEAPFMEKWMGSGHADIDSDAFQHWAEDDPPVISTSCAKCHSTTGLLDYLGEDGTDFGSVENTAPGGEGIQCAACHNATAVAMTEVTFPSGAVIGDLGKGARCMNCHQGRESSVSVDAAIAEAAPADDDTVSEDLGFKNIHYFAAGATLLGGQAMGGYQYEGKLYDGRFTHEEGFTTCNDCHDPHTLQVMEAKCVACHGDGAKEDYRMHGSFADYDGDGDTDEGVKAEIEGLQAAAFAALQAYAADTIGTGIIYDSHSYPYFFIDTNGNGEADEDEVNYGNKYASWTSRLLRGAFNYQFSQKDPGAYAHNAKYVIALLYDSIEDLGGDVTGFERNDHGHFDGTTEAFRHWDEDDFIVSASCQKCHTAAGAKFQLEHGAVSANAMPASDGLTCDTCHTGGDYATNAARRYIAKVTFPSGVVISNDADNPDQSFTCMSCHQGRESTPSVNAAIAAADPDDDDAVTLGLGFKNIHYLATGATRYGAVAMGGYQYDGKHYDGYFGHENGFSQCTDCHGAHDFAIKTDACSACHEGGLEDFRMPGSSSDYDGDGDSEEGVHDEIAGLKVILYAAIQDYALNTAGTGILYDSHSYPYYFTDTNGNGVADDGEISYGNKYATWTPRLLRAAYNYQYSKKDPGAFAHNAKYVIQLMYDSIEDLGAADGLHRQDHGHFDSTTEAWRHWDEDGGISTSCAKCHTPTGANEFLATGAIADEQPVSDGLTCNVCHVGDAYVGGAALKYVESFTFPSGEVIPNDPADPDNSFLCLTCHTGRQSMTSIQANIDDPEESPGFKNVHYLPAGAVLYGSDSLVGYEYDGKTYKGKFTHWGGASAQCSYCHVADGEEHGFEPVLSPSCTGCHDEASGDLMAVRKNRTTDYDGDGDNTEPLHDELVPLADALYLAIQANAAANGTPLVYSGGSYPYFFKDTNGNGDVDPGEAIYPNSFKGWTDDLMIAAHHFQMFQKEHGAWAHNTDYMAQLLIDSIEAMGGDVSMYNRP